RSVSLKEVENAFFLEDPIAYPVVGDPFFYLIAEGIVALIAHVSNEVVEDDVLSVAELLCNFIKVGRQYHDMPVVAKEALHYGFGAFVGVVHISAFKEFIHEHKVRLG